MNLYEEVLYEVYVKCFEKSFFEDIKEWNRSQKNFFLILLITFCAIFLGFIGIFLKIYILVLPLYISFVVFLISAFSLLVSSVKNYKTNIILFRNNREKKLRKFNLELIQHGYRNDTQIEGMINSLRLNYSFRCKVKERRFDNYFKIFITFLLSAAIFIGKEKWERFKIGISEENFNTIFEASIIILIFIGCTSSYIYLVNRDSFGKKKEEKLLKALEEVLVYRQKIKVSINNNFDI